MYQHFCRVPPQSLQIYYKGAYREMNRASDNYFVAFADGGAAFQLPTQIAITSILGDVVYDTLATSTPSVRLCHTYHKAPSLLSPQSGAQMIPCPG